MLIPLSRNNKAIWRSEKGNSDQTFLFEFSFFCLPFWLKLFIKLTELCLIIWLKLSNFFLLTWIFKLTKFFLNVYVTLLEMVTSQNLSETFPLRGVFSSLSGYREIGKINSRELSDWEIINTELVGWGPGPVTQFAQLSIKERLVCWEWSVISSARWGRGGREWSEWWALMSTPSALMSTPSAQEVTTNQLAVSPS